MCSVIDLVTLFLSVTAFFGKSTATDIKISPKEAVKNVGEELAVLCTVTPTAAIEQCLINIGHRDYVPIQKSDGDITYYGAGLEKGECGAIIKQVARDHNGPIFCKILLKDNSNVFNEAAMNLIVTKKPKPPVLTIKPARPLVEGEEVTASCGVADGRPSADIVLNVENESFNVTDDKIETDNGTTMMTNAKWHVSAGDDGRIIVCTASHYSWKDNISVNETISVHYKPKIYNEKGEIQKQDIVFSGLELGKNASLIVKVKSNPKPTDVGWAVGNSTVFSRNKHDRFEAIEKHAKNGSFYVYMLVITNLTENDVNEKYSLEVNNTVGSRLVDINLEAKRIKDHEKPNKTPQSMAGGTTIGVISAVLVLVILIGAVMIAKFNNKCCFASKTPPAHTVQVIVKE